MSIESFLKIAKKNAMRSTEDYRVGACLVSSGRVLSVGVNQKNKINRLVRQFFNNFPTMHAEAACMSELSPDAIKGSTLYVYRYRNNVTPGLAKPCIRCARLIQALGVKRVIYSTDIYPYYGIWEVRHETIEQLAPAKRRWPNSPLALSSAEV
jgi:deoxycytidylate deaminase